MTSEELAGRYIKTLRDTFGFKDIKWYDRDHHEVVLGPLDCCDKVRTLDWQRMKHYDNYARVEYCAEHEIAHVYTKHIKFFV